MRVIDVLRLVTAIRPDQAGPMKQRVLTLLMPSLLFSGCALLEQKDDPMLAKMEQLERRLESIERVVQNQSLVNLTQQVNSVERRGESCKVGSKHWSMTARIAANASASSMRISIRVFSKSNRLCKRAAGLM